MAIGDLRLKWRDGPFPICGQSFAASKGLVYCCDNVSNFKVLMMNSRTGQWTLLSKSFSPRL